MQVINIDTMSKRRRLPNNNIRGPEEGNHSVEVEDIDYKDEIEIQQIVNILDEDSDDDEVHTPPPIIPREGFTGYSSTHAQRSIYLALFILIGLFMLWVNYYNTQQLQRIKEEYGPDKKIEPELWWSKALIYQVYVRSFKDSDGNGIGDLKGLRLHLEHFLYLGVDAIQLSDIFESPMKDLGRDVTNFTNIDPLYGSVQDFIDLVTECHEKGIKVILELVPNHTSKRHPWFEESRKGGGKKKNKYHDYYMWQDGKLLKNGTILPPNNWLSMYGGSAWTYDSIRGQFYYHKFHTSEPDLNHRDQAVHSEVDKLLQHWLSPQMGGIDGLVLGGVQLYFEADDTSLDEPTSDAKGVLPWEYGYLEHLFTEDHADIHDFLTNWREVIDRVASQRKQRIPLVVDVEDDQVTDVIKYYFTGGDTVTCRQLMKITSDCNAYCVQDLVEVIRMHMPDEKDPLWMIGDPDHRRLLTVKGPVYGNVLMMLMMLLPGGARSFQGEELGLGDTRLAFPQTVDIRGKLAGPDRYKAATRDYSRGPLPWTMEAEHNWGFTTAKQPWLPFADGTEEWHTVEKQKTDPQSPFNLYGRFSRLRKEHSFILGDFQYSLVTDDLFSFMRFGKNSAPYLIVMNLGEATAERDFTPSAGVQYGKVIVHAPPNGKKGNTRLYVEGKTMNLETVRLEPGEGVVVMMLLDMVLM